MSNLMFRYGYFVVCLFIFFNGKLVFDDFVLQGHEPTNKGMIEWEWMQYLKWYRKSKTDGSMKIVSIEILWYRLQYRYIK